MLLTPKVYSFNTATYQCSTADAYGKGASSSSDNNATSTFADMYCTIHNLITGTPGKAAALGLIAMGFVRASGMTGSGGVMSAAIPFILGVGLATADRFANALGYEVN